MSRPRKIPSYRLHKQSGQAVVTLTDGFGNRRDVLLGHYNSEQSRAEYLRVLGEWEAAGRRLTQHSAESSAKPDLTVNELILDYWRFAEQYYGFDTNKERGDAACLRGALAVVREQYGPTLAVDFGPLSLKACREQMVKLGWSRSYVNVQIDRVRRMFKWAAGEELLTVNVYQNLQAVQGLRRSKSKARETDRVKPVDPEHVEAALPFMPRPIAGMVRFQQLTGCRPGEACLLRACDLDVSNADCWIFRPYRHKTEHHGHERIVLIGPRAQEVIRPFLTTESTAYLFCPREATRERNEKRRAERKTPLYPSHAKAQNSKRKRRPLRAPGECYNTRAYQHAIARACKKAGVPVWGPNRLRHNRATEIRGFGLDMTKTILGHSKVETSQIYAEKDMLGRVDVASCSV